MSRYSQWVVAIFVGALTLVAFESDGWANEGAPDSQEGTFIGAMLGYDLDIAFEEGEAFAGADARFAFDMPDVSPGFSLAINPAFSFYFVSDVTALRVDGNVLGQFALDGGVIPYGGAGIAVMHWSDDFDSNTEIDINLFVGGAKFPIDPGIDGFGQIRLTRHSFGEGGFSFSWTSMSIMGGIMFGM